MTRWWAVGAVAGCALALAGLVWYVRCLEDKRRRVHPAWPLGLFAAGCLVVFGTLAAYVQWGDR